MVYTLHLFFIHYLQYEEHFFYCLVFTTDAESCEVLSAVTTAIPTKPSGFTESGLMTTRSAILANPNPTHTTRTNITGPANRFVIAKPNLAISIATKKCWGDQPIHKQYRVSELKVRPPQVALRSFRRPQLSPIMQIVIILRRFDRPIAVAKQT